MDRDFAAFLVSVLLVAAIMTLGALLFGWTTCMNKARMAQVEHSFGPLQGCMVRINGQWVPIENWRVL